MEKSSNSSIEWSEKNKSGKFVITSGVGKTAKGFITTDDENKLIFKVEESNYSSSYLRIKMKTFLSDEDIKGQERVIITRNINIRSHTIIIKSKQIHIKNMTVGQTYTLTRANTTNPSNYSGNGLWKCNGQALGLPRTLTYQGEVFKDCGGDLSWRKFKEQ